MDRGSTEQASGSPSGGTERIGHDEAGWPLVDVCWQPDHSTDELVSHIRRLQSYVDRGEAFTLLYDVSQARPINSLERRQFTEFFSRNREPLEEHCRGVAYVTQRTIHRGILTAIGWFITLPFPLEVFATREQGLEWLGQIDTEANERVVG